ncbi:MAG TPA: 5'/3'-nucleotidase SurE [Edaphocola sp.]|nr:5'/3'-nucleotidase SurE [Edaphocola sp.]
MAFIPNILIVNDDGITAPGIASLIEAVHDLGKITVVAPDSPQSGMGHAVTIGNTLRLEKVDLFKEYNIEAYQCSGTPVDCVKIAQDVVLDYKPDICLSGINHGSNASINVIYSGTMSAAMEAAINDIPAVGFSLMDFKWEADFSVAKQVVRTITEKMLRQRLPENFLLNVNIPRIIASEFKGIKIARQAMAQWRERFEKRKDPHGNDYYWMSGKFENSDKGDDTDLNILKEGYASVVPVKFDLTDEVVGSWLKSNWDL